MVVNPSRGGKGQGQGPAGIVNYILTGGKETWHYQVVLGFCERDLLRLPNSLSRWLDLTQLSGDPGRGRVLDPGPAHLRVLACVPGH